MSVYAEKNVENKISVVFFFFRIKTPHCIIIRNLTSSSRIKKLHPQQRVLCVETISAVLKRPERRTHIYWITRGRNSLYENASLISGIWYPLHNLGFHYPLPQFYQLFVHKRALRFFFFFCPKCIRVSLCIFSFTSGLHTLFDR